MKKPDNDLGIDGVIQFCMFTCFAAFCAAGVFFFRFNLIASAALFILSAVFLGIFIYLRRNPIYKKTDRSYLKQKGLRITAKCTEIKKVESRSVKQAVSWQASSPSVIVAAGANPLTGKMTDFESEYIWWVDPKGLVKKGRNVDVYIDQKNPDIYYMDVSFLEEEVRKMEEELKKLEKEIG